MCLLYIIHSHVNRNCDGDKTCRIQNPILITFFKIIWQWINMSMAIFLMFPKKEQKYAKFSWGKLPLKQKNFVVLYFDVQKTILTHENKRTINHFKKSFHAFTL